MGRRTLSATEQLKFLEKRAIDARRQGKEGLARGIEETILGLRAAAEREQGGTRAQRLTGQALRRRSTRAMAEADRGLLGSVEEMKKSAPAATARQGGGGGPSGGGRGVPTPSGLSKKGAARALGMSKALKKGDTIKETAKKFHTSQKNVKEMLQAAGYGELVNKVLGKAKPQASPGKAQQPKTPVHQESPEPEPAPKPKAEANTPKALQQQVVALYKEIRETNQSNMAEAKKAARVDELHEELDKAKARLAKVAPQREVEEDEEGIPVESEFVPEEAGGRVLSGEEAKEAAAQEKPVYLQPWSQLSGRVKRFRTEILGGREAPKEKGFPINKYKKLEERYSQTLQRGATPIRRKDKAITPTDPTTGERTLPTTNELESLKQEAHTLMATWRRKTVGEKPRAPVGPAYGVTDFGAAKKDPATQAALTLERKQKGRRGRVSALQTSDEKKLKMARNIARENERDLAEDLDVPEHELDLQHIPELLDAGWTPDEVNELLQEEGVNIYDLQEKGLLPETMGGYPPLAEQRERFQGRAAQEAGTNVMATNYQPKTEEEAEFREQVKGRTGTGQRLMYDAEMVKQVRDNIADFLEMNGVPREQVGEFIPEVLGAMKEELQTRAGISHTPYGVKKLTSKVSAAFSGGPRYKEPAASVGDVGARATGKGQDVVLAEEGATEDAFMQRFREGLQGIPEGSDVAEGREMAPSDVLMDLVRDLETSKMAGGTGPGQKGNRSMGRLLNENMPDLAEMDEELQALQAKPRKSREDKARIRLLVDTIRAETSARTAPVPQGDQTDMGALREASLDPERSKHIESGRLNDLRDAAQAVIAARDLKRIRARLEELRKDESPEAAREREALLSERELLYPQEKAVADRRGMAVSLRPEGTDVPGTRRAPSGELLPRAQWLEGDPQTQKPYTGVPRPEIEPSGAVAAQVREQNRRLDPRMTRPTPGNLRPGGTMEPPESLSPAEALGKLREGGYPEAEPDEEKMWRQEVIGRVVDQLVGGEDVPPDIDSVTEFIRRAESGMPESEIQAGARTNRPGYRGLEGEVPDSKVVEARVKEAVRTELGRIKSGEGRMYNRNQWNRLAKELADFRGALRPDDPNFGDIERLGGLAQRLAEGAPEGETRDPAEHPPTAEINRNVLMPRQKARRGEPLEDEDEAPGATNKSVAIEPAMPPIHGGLPPNLDDLLKRGLAPAPPTGRDPFWGQPLKTSAPEALPPTPQLPPDFLPEILSRRPLITPPTEPFPQLPGFQPAPPMGPLGFQPLMSEGGLIGGQMPTGLPSTPFRPSATSEGQARLNTFLSLIGQR